MFRRVYPIGMFLLGFLLGSLVFGEWFEDDDPMENEVGFLETTETPVEKQTEEFSNNRWKKQPQMEQDAEKKPEISRRTATASPGQAAIDKEICSKQTLHELKKLRSENVYLKDRLNESEDYRRAAEGEPIEPPEDLHERFTQEPLRVAVDEALEETGFSGEVNLVDCEEYPCIVSGRLDREELDNPEALHLLFKTDALQNYNKDRRQISVNEVEYIDQEGEKRKDAFFSISFYPENESDRQAAIHDRVIQRERQILDAFLGR